MRLQLALDVTDLDRAVDFYTRLFDTPPAKRKPGYANFAITDPPLKLVLFEGEADGTINHLGVEVERDDEVTAAAERLDAAGLAPTTVAETTCCHADKLETWVDGPDGTHWEIYRKVADVDVPGAGHVGTPPDTSESEPAVATCTLPVTDLPDRMAQARRLHRHLLGSSRDGDDLGLTLRFRPAGRAEVHALVAAESDCCSFFRFHVAASDEVVELVVRTSEGGREWLDRLGNAILAG